MDNLFDVVIVGGGPAGLSAAIYLARARYKVLVIEKDQLGGQITITSEVVNYPGIPLTNGKELTENMRKQAQSFGAEFVSDYVVEYDLENDYKIIKTEKGNTYQSLGVVLALGANPRKVGFIGEKEFQGRGVAYCATCDGEFFTNKDIFVIGGGFAAIEEAMFLTKYGKKIIILVRKDHFSCAQSIVDKLKDYPTIEVLYNTELLEVTGDQTVKKAILFNNQTQEKTEYTAQNNDILVFLFLPVIPLQQISFKILSN